MSGSPKPSPDVDNKRLAKLEGGVSAASLPPASSLNGLRRSGYSIASILIAAVFQKRVSSALRELAQFAQRAQ